MQRWLQLEGICRAGQEASAVEGDRLFPLICLEYEPGSIDAAVDALDDALARDVASMELRYYRGDCLRCQEEALGLAAKDDAAVRATAAAYCGFALEAAGDASGAASSLRKCMETGIHARARLEAIPGDKRSASADEADIEELYTLLLVGDLCAGALGCLKERQGKFDYLSARSLTSPLRMLGCIAAATGALNDGRYAYSSGLLKGIILTSRIHYPLLVAIAQLVIAIDLVMLGDDEAAKNEFMESFEVLQKDNLLQPIAGMYRGLMGLPDACLRKRYGRILKELQSRAQVASCLARDANPRIGELPSSPLLKPQESSFVQLAALGKTNDEIAAFMGVTTHTVKYHLSNAYAKLNIEGRAELVPASS